jgi:hypothetical protein
MTINKSKPSPRARSENRVVGGLRYRCKEEPEKITIAAIRLTNGAIYTGLFHGDAFMEAKAAHAHNSPSYHGRLFGNSVDGFMTSRGRFVEAEEAFELAVKARQITARSHERSVKDLWVENISAGRWLSSLSFNIVRIF